MGHKIVTFGELMLRFSKEDKKRLSQGRMFCGNYGGSEANVAVSLAMQGLIEKFQPVEEICKAGKWKDGVIMKCSREVMTL